MIFGYILSRTVALKRFKLESSTCLNFITDTLFCSLLVVLVSLSFMFIRNNTVDVFFEIQKLIV